MIDATPLSEVLEKHIDRIGLCDMLNLLVNICDEKGNHLRHNWQDTATAKVWEQAAARIRHVAEHTEI